VVYSFITWERYIPLPKDDNILTDLCTVLMVEVRISMVNALQFVYGEDGMDGAFIKRQDIDMFSLNNKMFEHNYQIDVADPVGGFLPDVLQVGPTR
jgi:hypothetical protein